MSLLCVVWMLCLIVVVSAICMLSCWCNLIVLLGAMSMLQPSSWGRAAIAGTRFLALNLQETVFVLELWSSHYIWWVLRRRLEVWATPCHPKSDAINTLELCFHWDHQISWIYRARSLNLEQFLNTTIVGRTYNPVQNTISFFEEWVPRPFLESIFFLKKGMWDHCKLSKKHLTCSFVPF